MPGMDIASKIEMEQTLLYRRANFYPHLPSENFPDLETFSNLYPTNNKVGKY